MYNNDRATIGFNIIGVIAILAPAIPEIYGSSLDVPNFALQNAMACYVYRRLKLPGQWASGVSTLSWTTPPTLPSTVNVGRSGGGSTKGGGRTRHVRREIACLTKSAEGAGWPYSVTPKGAQATAFPATTIERPYE